MGQDQFETIQREKLTMKMDGFGIGDCWVAICNMVSERQQQFKDPYKHGTGAGSMIMYSYCLVRAHATHWQDA